MTNFTINSLRDQLELDFLNMLVESIDNGEINNILTESTLDTTYLFKYSVLVETVTEIEEFNKLIASGKTEEDPDKKINAFKKVINGFKKLLSWYYKIDPDKKLPILRLIIKSTNRMIIHIFLFSKIKDKKVKINLPGLAKKDSKFMVHSKLVTKTIDKLPEMAGGKKLISKGPKFAKKIFTKSTLVKSAFMLLLDCVIMPLLDLIDKKLIIAYNAKDIDKTIADLENMIDSLNEVYDSIKDNEDEIELRNLSKVTMKYENALTELVRLKKEIDKNAADKAAKQKKREDQKLSD